jgi:aryl-alcohol dehydrogenase-like predicted oxidoreductase
MSYGAPSWRPWVLSEQDARPFFKRALEAGINFFDTADMYSLGVSEEITGKCLREMGKIDELVIATKVRFNMSKGPNMGGLSKKHVQQACEASLKRLGVETIDLYQIHRLDKDTPIEDTLEALELLVQQGKIRYIGASSMPAWKFQKALGYSEKKNISRFISMQNHYNLVYREEEREMLPLCAEEGVAVIPWSPLARGMLAGARVQNAAKPATKREESDEFAHDLYDMPADWEVVDAVKKVAEKRGVQPAEVALAWLLSRPTVTAPIVGATKLDHLEAAIRAVDLKLSEEEIRILEAPYVPHGVRGMWS